MYGGGATVSVVADVPNTVLYCIEKTALQLLFQSKPELAAKFYKFLAAQISDRLVPQTRARTTSSADLVSDRITPDAELEPNWMKKKEQVKDGKK